jgi:transposase InsO family protein
VTLIGEAVGSGARISQSCQIIGISVSTYRRWKAVEEHIDKRRGAVKRVNRKLSEAERQQILDTCCEKRFADLTPYAIYAILLDEDTYLASVSTMYRILRTHNLLHHRGESRQSARRAKPPELKATGPNQVWSWDITYLPTQVRGIFLFAYVLIDVWSRKIVGWEIHTEESEAHARDFFRRVASGQNVQGVHLHADNGNAMKGVTVLVLFFSLGIIPSFSQPRVSNDNPYSESLFKTIKYTPGYPKRFTGIDQARAWFADFVHWYNTEHRHSGIGYITPDNRHTGNVAKIMRKRNQVLTQARELNPERWPNGQMHWEEQPIVYLNPDPTTRQSLLRKTA